MPSSLFASTSSTAEPSMAPSHRQTLKFLSINRSMLTQAYVDLTRLKYRLKKMDANDLKRQLIQTQYKIKALEEESDRLRSFLPSPEQAQEFMNDLLLEKSIEQFAKSLTREETQDLERLSMQVDQIASSSSPAASTAIEITPSPRSSSADTSRLHEQALQFVSVGQLDEAIRVYEEIILGYPNDAEAYVILGHCYLMTDRYDQAARSFKNAIHLDAENKGEILPFYQNMILQNPDDVNAHAFLGIAYWLSGDSDKALESFKDAIEMDPDNARAIDGMARLAQSPSQF